MKLQFIVLTKPQEWSMTDEDTGLVRKGVSAIVYLPGEAAAQKVSTLPKGTQLNASYFGNWGLKNKTVDGKSQAVLDLIDVDLSTEKIIKWDSVLK